MERDRRPQPGVRRRKGRTRRGATTGGGTGKASRQDLERHVIAVQRTVRTCGGCGQCCTEGYNAVRILPAEAVRIVRHLGGLPPARRDPLLRRAWESVERYGLRSDGPKVRCTCPFLEDDLRCALPLRVKPTACLSFNPLGPGRCGQEPGWYFAVHDREEIENRRAGLDARDAPIPVAVLATLRDDPGLHAPGPNGLEPKAPSGVHGRTKPSGGGPPRAHAESGIRPRTSAVEPRPPRTRRRRRLSG